MLRPRHLLSGLTVLAVTAGLGVLPVITPAWAQPRPVAPSVKTWPLSGLDRTALAATPPAFDPATADAADPDTRSGKRAATTTVPAVFTSTVDTGRFTAAGVSWSPTGAPADVVVQVRVREGGAWGEWHPLDREGGPDAGTPEARNATTRVATAPLVSPEATGVQVRVDSATGAAPADLQLLTVDPGTSAADASFGAPASSASAATTQPGIYTRAQWGADERLVGSCSGYSPTIKVGFVHHTVSTNSYAPDQVAGLLRGIYGYHVQGNGWCDIGYNFLVDKFGRVFEGRHGGIARTPIGAHTLAFNYNSFSVSAIGDYTSAAPGSALLGGITSVMGWKLGLHKRSATGFNQLVSAGGAGAKWPAGTVVNFATVSGHRDAYATSCPGGALYSQLQTIRNNAARYAASQTRRDENLYGTLSGAGSGRVEIHSQSASSLYRSRMSDVATRWASSRPEDWTFAVGSNMGDSRPDLIGVHRRNTGSGRVDVHVASWASGYTSTTVNTITPMPTIGDEWQVSVGGPSGGDVYLIRLRGGSSRTLEVHSLSSDSDYTQWRQHSSTALPQLAASSGPTVMVAKGSGDLYAVLHGTTGSRHTEVHAVTAASRYRTFIAHAVTPLGATSDTRAQWVLGTAPTPDLYLVPTAGTGSGKVEVHRISAASRWSGFSLHVATNLPAYGGPRWQFSMG